MSGVGRAGSFVLMVAIGYGGGWFSSECGILEE